jgi:hypothetical protein
MSAFDIAVLAVAYGSMFLVMAAVVLMVAFDVWSAREPAESLPVDEALSVHSHRAPRRWSR